jgi:hypothetical protein
VRQLLRRECSVGEIGADRGLDTGQRVRPKNYMEGESETSGLIGWKFRGRDEEKFTARTYSHRKLYCW